MSVQDQILNTALREGTKMAGDALVNYFTGQYRTARDLAYDELTSKKGYKTIPEHFKAGSRVKPTGNYQTDLFEDEPEPATQMGNHWKQYGPLYGYPDGKKTRIGWEQQVRPTQAEQEPILNRATGEYEAYYDKKPSEYADWIPRGAYQNPETVATAVGLANPLAQIGAATAIGAGIYNFSKPRSEYSAPVDEGQFPPYNANVAAAEAKYLYTQQIEKQKHQNQIDLLNHKERIRLNQQQSLTPGVQDYGQAVLGRQASPSMPQMGDPYAMVNNIMSARIPNYGV